VPVNPLRGSPLTALSNSTAPAVILYATAEV
jgi:hypothetical protein